MRKNPLAFGTSTWCVEVRQKKRVAPPGERNGLYGARCVPKQKTGEFEQARGIEPQSAKERQILSPSQVKRVAFGNSLPDLNDYPPNPYPSALP